MGSDPWTPSKALPWGPYSTPDPQLARAMTFACRHDILKIQQTFGGGGLRGGGSHEIFTNREGGSTIFLLLPGGDQKFNRVFHPVSTTPPPPPRELKNDNSLSCCLRCLMKLTSICNIINFKFDSYSFAFTKRKVNRFSKFLILTFPMSLCFFYQSLNFIFHFVYFKNILPSDHSILI